MSNLAVLTVFLTLVASLAVHFANALICYDCVSGTPSRAGKQECGGDAENWQTCYVKEGDGSCLLMAFGK